MSNKQFIFAGFRTKFLSLLTILILSIPYAGNVWGDTDTYSGTASGGSITGWTGSGTGTYNDGSVKFDSSGDSYTKTNIWSGTVSTNMTSISVTLNYKMNGSGSMTSNVFTVAAVNSSGTVKASATFTPNATSASDKTVSLTIPASSAVTGLKLTYTTKGNRNVGLYSVSATATYTAAPSTYTVVLLYSHLTPLCLFIEPQESHKANFGVASD